MKRESWLFLHPIMKMVVVLLLVITSLLGLWPVVSVVAAKDIPIYKHMGIMVAYFGSPVIDGKIDPVWKKAQTVSPKFVSSNIDTSAAFKTLWDDNALRG